MFEAPNITSLIERGLFAAQPGSADIDTQKKEAKGGLKETVSQDKQAPKVFLSTFLLSEWGH